MLPRLSTRLGDTGDRVVELQSTLNSILQGPHYRSFVLDKPSGEDDDAVDDDGQDFAPPRIYVKQEENLSADKHGTIKLVARFNGAQLILNLSASKWDFEDEATPQRLTLKPGQEPLKVDGIYAAQTFAAVLLFQRKQNLNPTGEVDAVTLDRLEPLIPPNFILAKLMDWPRGLWEDEADTYAWRVKQTTSLLMFLILVAVCFVVHLIARSLARSTEFLSHWAFTPTSSPWFTTLKDMNFFACTAHFVPAIFLCLAANVYPAPGGSGHDPFPYLDTFERWYIFVSRLGLAYIAFVFVLVAMAYLDTCHQMFTKDRPKDNPIEGIVGAARRLVAAIGIILICAALAGRNPAYFVGGPRFAQSNPHPPVGHRERYIIHLAPLQRKQVCVSSAADPLARASSLYGRKVRHES
ncbi:MAG TPA: peptidoglycan-binding protein [Planctomycetes bacterium]|nr:peptidoglycan-binding protein [Fuerstiella sp.]HIK92846.1 peptidoglycan-binding protein [Planctomycetota bacterium]